MITNSRKYLRRDVRYTAWLQLPDKQLHGCVLSNASEQGACIDVEDSKVVPDKFTLLLASSGKARRHCRVVWRKPQRVGVKFEQRVIARKKDSVMPVFDGNEVRLEPVDG